MAPPGTAPRRDRREWLVDGLLAGWEELAKTALRESAHAAIRFVNGASALGVWLFFDRRAAADLRMTFRRPEAGRNALPARLVSAFNDLVTDADDWRGAGHGLGLSQGLSHGLSQGLSSGLGTESDDDAGRRESTRDAIPDSITDSINDSVRGSLDGSHRGVPPRPPRAGLLSRLNPFRRCPPRPPPVGSPARTGLPRNGSGLFGGPRVGTAGGAGRPAGTRGLAEDGLLAAEVGVTLLFGVARSGLRRLLLLPPPPPPAPPGQEPAALPGRGGGDWASTWAGGLGLSGGGGQAAAKTAGDLIREAGYPYEVYEVRTSDGYLLQLGRMPRRGARGVAFFQHGLVDSSLGWVCNGATGSTAFGAFDLGFDVFLGELRGCPPHAHANPRATAREYWAFSVNEHGTRDIPALIGELHRLKCAEFGVAVGPSGDDDGVDSGVGGGGVGRRWWGWGGGRDDEGAGGIDWPPWRDGSSPGNGPTSGDGSSTPYTLQAVAHSEGGAGLLIYAVRQRRCGLPHRISRLVLLSPAGFHAKIPAVCACLGDALTLAAPLLAPLCPAFYIPTRGLRLLFGKVMADVHRLPAVAELMRATLGGLLSGDGSHWSRAMLLPHYVQGEAMPGLSYRVVRHFWQLHKRKKFELYDYGARGNWEHYGRPRPPDVAAQYGLIDFPVDLVAGSRDGVIHPDNVRMHAAALAAAGRKVTFKELDYGHLDFTMSARDELRSYVLARLALQPGG